MAGMLAFFQERLIGQAPGAGLPACAFLGRERRRLK